MDEFLGMTNDEQVDHVLRGIKSAARLRNIDGRTLGKIFDAGFVAARQFDMLPDVVEPKKYHETDLV